MRGTEERFRLRQSGTGFPRRTGAHMRRGGLPKRVATARICSPESRPRRRCCSSAIERQLRRGAGVLYAHPEAAARPSPWCGRIGKGAFVPSTRSAAPPRWRACRRRGRIGAKGGRRRKGGEAKAGAPASWRMTVVDCSCAVAPPSGPHRRRHRRGGVPARRPIGGGSCGGVEGRRRAQREGDDALNRSSRSRRHE